MDNFFAEVDAPYVVTILSVSRFEEDHLALERIFCDAEATLYPALRVRIARCSEAAGALTILHSTRMPLVVYDIDERPDRWKQTAREFQGLSAAPCLILSSRIADDRLCVEAAKHGVYEVLAKPFLDTEVLRIIKMAWLHWQHRYGLPAAEAEAGKPAAGTQIAPIDVYTPGTPAPKINQCTEE